jgi:hypothetical protein
MQLTDSQLEQLVNDPEIRRAAASTLKGFCLTYLPHHFPLDPSEFFDEMCAALESADIQRLEVIGFRGCAKGTVASLALVLWAALEHPDKYPFIIMLADTRSQASINAASVQHELRNNDLILKDYGHLKYKKIDDPRPEPTLESDEDWQAMNCVLDNGVRILSRSRDQKIRGLKHRQHRPSLIIDIALQLSGPPSPSGTRVMLANNDILEGSIKDLNIATNATPQRRIATSWEGTLRLLVSDDQIVEVDYPEIQSVGPI